MYVVTDTIETATETGIFTSKGTVLDADIIVMTMGLKMRFAGGTNITVDRTPIKVLDKYI